MIKQVIFFAISFLIGYSAAGDNSFLHTEVKGSGNPMILIHGMACSAEVWDEVAEYYEDRHELHLISLPGFGNPDNFETPHILEAIRDALIAYVKTEGLIKPMVMGHSMGGFLALWAASVEPDLFGPIISVDGLPYFPVLVMPGITPETAEPFVKQMQAGMSGQSPEMVRASQEMMIATMISNPDKRGRVVDMGLRSNSRVIGQAMGEMYTTDIRGIVNAIKQPVLVLGAWYAYRDWGVTKESVRAGFEAQFNVIPNARVAMANTAYHFIFYDEPEWFFQTVDEFLQDQI
jgi:pimeloyl-ACP methyl ester carboxylesterase